jgi:uncharacterized protein (TIGR03663 family)
MSDEQSTRGNRSTWTIERAAWIGVGLLAAVIRFAQLGLRPLSEGEVVQALAALRFVQPAAQAASQATGQIAPVGTVPLLFTGNVAAFSLLGAGDMVARWLPALAGVILVLLPYGLRHRLGRLGALAAALLMAVSPIAVFYSRALDGAVLVAACGLALVVGLINYLDTQRPGYLYMAAAALGVGLGAGPGIYTLVLIFVLFGGLLYLVARRPSQRPVWASLQGGWSSLCEVWDAARAESGLLTRAGIVLVATFALVATTFVLHPAGIGLSADLIAAWARGFLPDPGSHSILYPLLLLLRYELLILVMGRLAASQILMGRWRDPGNTNQAEPTFPLTAFLAFWALAAILIVVFSGHRPSGNLLLALVPLALSAGQGIEWVVRWLAGQHHRDRRFGWHVGLVAGVALGLLVFLYLQIAAYSQADAEAVASTLGINLYVTTSYLLLALVPLLLLIGLGAVAWNWQGKAPVLGGGWLVVLLVLGMFTIKGMWNSSFARASDPREFLILDAAHPDVRDMAASVEELSLAKGGDSHTLPITVDASTGPVVEWYLRDFEDQTIVEGLSEPPETIAAIALLVEDPPIGETFRGRGFPLHSSWSPRGLSIQALTGWLLFTEGPQPEVDQEVVLWVSNQP